MEWDREISHFDAPLREISIEELQEQADEVDYLTPREFAKLINVAPQQVYGWIRKGVIVDERCQCGRRVVQVSRAQATLQARKSARGEVLDTRPDRPPDEGLGPDVFEELSQTDSLQGSGNPIREEA